MSMKTKMLGLTLSLLSVASQAATARAESHFTDLQYAVIDLDPADGIDASLSWEIQLTSLGTEYPVGGFVNGFDWGDYDLVTHGVSLTAKSDGVHLVADATALTGARGTSQREGYFILSPHSQVTFSGLADLTLIGAEQFKEPFSCAVISLDLGGGVPNLMTDARLEASGRTSELVSLVYSNETDAPLTRHIGFYQGVQLYDRIPPVPEADAWMLLFAGLSVVAYAGRVGRRQV